MSNLSSPSSAPMDVSGAVTETLSTRRRPNRANGSAYGRARLARNSAIIHSHVVPATIESLVSASRA